MLSSIIKKKYIIILCILFIIGFLYYENNHIDITTINYNNIKVPKNFDGFSILQLSDLHNKSFGKNQTTLINKTKDINPDIIVITGDLIDKRRTTLDDIENSLIYLKSAINIAPIYFVPGNHESKSDVYEYLKNEMELIGVNVLDNKNMSIEKNGDKINLLGIDDLMFFAPTQKDIVTNLEMELQDLTSDKKDDFNILLAHRPSFINIYSKYNLDLVLSGHCHGGQVRIPFIGGLFSPDDYFFPKYDSGLYKVKETDLIVSRGLGNSIAPQRIFNNPELIVVKLQNR